MEIIVQKRNFEREIPAAGFCNKHGHFSELGNFIDIVDLPPEYYVGRHAGENALICPECYLQGTIRICKP